jgi:conjugative transfer signal peptidase TraF
LSAPPASVRAGRIRRALALTATAVIAAAAVALVACLHLTLNRTGSMPVGFYRRLPVDHAPARGDIVMICAPEALARFAARQGYLPPGDCPAHTAALLKHVAAVAGDVVEVRPDAVIVNGTRLAHSATRALDGSGRRLAHVAPGRYVIAPGRIWLWTISPIGWDSRYYGALPSAGVRAFAVPFAVLPSR